jgi:hypothetical protein
MYHFGDRWQVRPLVWSMPANSNGGLERVVDLHEVCALVAHQGEERQWRVFVCEELMDEFRNGHNFLSRVMTGDETWLYCYDPDSSPLRVAFGMSLKFRNSC